MTLTEIKTQIMEVCKSLGDCFRRAWQGDKGGTVDLEKFEEIAGALFKESEIMLLRDRTENTLRQRKQAYIARHGGLHLAEAGQAVAGLLAAIRDGFEVPDDLRVMSKSLAKRLTEPELERGVRTGEYIDNSETAVLFRSFINPNMNKIKEDFIAWCDDHTI